MNQNRAVKRRGKEYVTVRVDTSFKNALVEASRTEHRPLSNFCRLLLEHAFAEYRKVGSMRDLFLSSEHEQLRRNENADQRRIYSSERA